MPIAKTAYVATDVVLPEGADVRGRGRIETLADVIVLGPARTPPHYYTTGHRDDDIGIRVVRNCYSGTLEGYLKMAGDYARERPLMLADAQEYAVRIKEFFGIE